MTDRLPVDAKDKRIEILNKMILGQAETIKAREAQLAARPEISPKEAAHIIFNLDSLDYAMDERIVAKLKPPAEQQIKEKENGTY